MPKTTEIVNRAVGMLGREGCILFYLQYEFDYKIFNFKFNKYYLLRSFY